MLLIIFRRLKFYKKIFLIQNDVYEIVIFLENTRSNEKCRLRLIY